MVGVRPRIAFAGTPDFALRALERLHAEGYPLVQVLTQPDRPAGRGMKLQASPVKAFAQAHGLPLLQPRGLRLDGRFADDAGAARAALAAAAPAWLVVAAYGLILPPWLLALPAGGGLNIHASLLPRWRGAAPIQRAIEAGDAETGITIMQMDAGLDTGETLLREMLPIAADDTAARLHDRLAGRGAALIVDALEAAAEGRLSPTPQLERGATYARKIEKTEAAIDWHADAAVIERRVRAFDPFPGASFVLGGQTFKLWRAAVRPDVAAEPGSVVSAGDEPVVACGHGGLALQVLQRPGGRRLAARAALQGLEPVPGQRLARVPGQHADG